MNSSNKRRNCWKTKRAFRTFERNFDRIIISARVTYHPRHQKIGIFSNKKAIHDSTEKKEGGKKRKKRNWCDDSNCKQGTVACGRKENGIARIKRGEGRSSKMKRRHQLAYNAGRRGKDHPFKLTRQNHGETRARVVGKLGQDEFEGDEKWMGLPMGRERLRLPGEREKMIVSRLKNSFSSSFRDFDRTWTYE